MKVTMKYLVGLVIVAASLTACSKSGGGNASTPAAAPAATASGCATTGIGCILGGTGYVGDGNWKATLEVTNFQAYRQFLLENGLRSGNGARISLRFMKLNVRLYTGEFVAGIPSEGLIKITPLLAGSTLISGRSVRGLNWGGDAAANLISGATGFQLSYDPRQYFGNFGIVAPASNTAAQYLVVTATFVDATHSQINVTVRYKSEILAQGVLVDPNVGYGNSF